MHHIVRVDVAPSWSSSHSSSCFSNVFESLLISTLTWNKSYCSAGISASVPLLFNAFYTLFINFLIPNLSEIVTDVHIFISPPDAIVVHAWLSKTMDLSWNILIITHSISITVISVFLCVVNSMTIIVEGFRTVLAPPKFVSLKFVGDNISVCSVVFIKTVRNLFVILSVWITCLTGHCKGCEGCDWN